MAEPNSAPPGLNGLPALPAGTPTWITPALVKHTIEVWQPYYDEPLTADDAAAMICDTSRLMETLEPDH